jgi:hypothetical protein
MSIFFCENNFFFAVNFFCLSDRIFSAISNQYSHWNCNKVDFVAPANPIKTLAGCWCSMQQWILLFASFEEEKKYRISNVVFLVHLMRCWSGKILEYWGMVKQSSVPQKFWLTFALITHEMFNKSSLKKSPFNRFISSRL